MRKKLIAIIAVLVLILSLLVSACVALEYRTKQPPKEQSNEQGAGASKETENEILEQTPSTENIQEEVFDKEGSNITETATKEPMEEIPEETTEETTEATTEATTEESPEVSTKIPTNPVTEPQPTQTEPNTEGSEFDDSNETDLV